MVAARIRLATRKTVRIHTQVDPELLTGVTGFGMLVVRLGGSAKNQTLNREIRFHPVSDRGTLEARVRCRHRHGFTFKCFVDYAPLTYDEARILLSNAGFTKISKGEGKPNRAWFLLPEYPPSRDGRFVNNEFLPS